MLPGAAWTAVRTHRSKRFVLPPQSVVNVLGRLVLAILLFSSATSYSENIKAERRRAEQILNLVSKDVQNNFYDDTLKGLNWPALTEQARQRIASAEELGQMHGAISALLYQLHDSHTVFIPPKQKIKAVYGFKAKPFANNIFVYEVDKDGPAAKGGLQLGDQIVGVNHLNAVRETFFDMMRYLTVLDPRVELDLGGRAEWIDSNREGARHSNPRTSTIFFQLYRNGPRRRSSRAFLWPQKLWRWNPVLAASNFSHAFHRDSRHDQTPQRREGCDPGLARKRRRKPLHNG